MELLEMIRLFNQDKLPSFIERIENKDIVLYLGLTKSGKSTLINCLIGTALKSKRIRSITHKITKVNNSDPGPVIGEGLQSSTHTPELYSYNNSFIMDTPGFFDNRVNQEIINALFLKQVRLAKTCKFVLVIDIIDIIRDDKVQFLRSLNSLVALVETDLSKSLSLVFTKVESDDNRDSILKILHDIIKQDELNITPEVRNLLRSIARRPEMISFFRMPTQEGLVVNNELLVDHLQAVSISQPITMKNITINISISPQILITVSESFSDYCNIIDFATFSVFHIHFAKYFNFDVERYVYASTDEELNEAEELASTFEQKIALEEQKKFPTIQDVVTSFRNLASPDTSDILFNEIQVFTDFGNLPSAKVLVEKYKRCLDVWHRDIKAFIKEIKNEKKYRSDRKLKFKIECGVIAGGTITALVGGIGLRAAVTEAATAALPATALVAIPFVGTGILAVGGVATVVTAGVTIARVVKKEIEYKKRIKERVKQGRPV